MGAEGRPADHPVVHRLQESPREFSFFQAVRVLELALADHVPVGRGGPASKEPVLLRASSSLAYQAAEVTRVEPPEGERERPRLTTTLFGLYGAVSPLPAFYSEDILSYETVNAPEQDPVRVFLDIFNHRLISLLYRAWSKYRWAFTFRMGALDQVSHAVLSLIGLGDREVYSHVGVPPQRLLRYAGFMTQTPKSARGLAGVVSDYFDDTPVDVEQCMERRVHVPEDDQNRLGVRKTVLGQSLTVGETVWDRTGKFRLGIGPVQDLEAFEAFLPSGRYFDPLGALIRLLIPDPLEYDLRLGIDGEAVPMLRVAIGDGAQRLGRTSWLRSEDKSSDKWEVFAAPALREAA